MNLNKNKKYDLNYLLEEDILDEKCTIEKLLRLNPYLTKSTPELYKIFLAQRPDLSDDVKNHYLNIIQKLEDREKNKIEEALKIMKDVNY
jgi:hypothetical protein